MQKLSNLYQQKLRFWRFMRKLWRKRLIIQQTSYLFYLLIRFLWCWKSLSAL